MSDGCVVLVFTGGTISMRHDEAAGGAIPMLTGRDILAATPGIEAIAGCDVVDFGAYPGPHMTVELQWELRALVQRHLARDDVRGVVITHGTDALEETAYLLARSLRCDKPVVLTGAMRSASDLGWDGPANLLAATRTAASADAVGQGVLVVMGERIFSALDVMKMHTHMLDAFDSPGLGPLGVLDGGRVVFRRVMPQPPLVLEPERPATPVDIVYAWAGADARLIDAARVGGQGLVIAAMGRGNVPPAMVPGIERWIAGGKPVVITSRALRGRVGHTYGYPGGGRRLHDAGALFAAGRRPPQARIDLMLALGAGLRDRALRAFFED